MIERMRMYLMSRAGQYGQNLIPRQGSYNDACMSLQIVILMVLWIKVHLNPQTLVCQLEKQGIRMLSHIFELCIYNCYKRVINFICNLTLKLGSVKEVKKYIKSISSYKKGIFVICPTSVIHSALQLCCLINNKFCHVFHGRWLQIESQHATE